MYVYNPPTLNSTLFTHVPKEKKENYCGFWIFFQTHIDANETDMRIYNAPKARENPNTETWKIKYVKQARGRVISEMAAGPYECGAWYGKRERARNGAQYGKRERARVGVGISCGPTFRSPRAHAGAHPRNKILEVSFGLWMVESMCRSQTESFAAVMHVAFLGFDAIMLFVLA